MLVVKIETWPEGKEIGRLYITNDGKSPGQTNQSYVAGEDPLDLPIEIASHTRSRGFWPLVKQAVALWVRRKGL